MSSREREGGELIRNTVQLESRDFHGNLLGSHFETRRPKNIHLRYQVVIGFRRREMLILDEIGIARQLFWLF